MFIISHYSGYCNTVDVELFRVTRRNGIAVDIMNQNINSNQRHIAVRSSIESTNASG